MKKILIILWVIIIGVFLLIYRGGTDQPLDIAEDSLNQPQTEEEIIRVSLNQAETYDENLLAGKSALDDLQYKKAMAHFEKAVDLEPDNLQALLYLGQSALKNNESLKARRAFQDAEDIDPQNENIQLQIARTYLADRDIKAAKDIVWTLDKEQDYEIRYYTGVILILYKDFGGAKQEFATIINSVGDPEEIPAKPGPSAMIVAKSEKYLSAFETYEAFRESPDTFLKTLLAKAMVDTEEYYSAIPLTFDVINQENNYRDAWIILGYAYLNTQQTADAIDAFSQALALDEEKPETLFFLGLSYFANEEIDKAITYLEKADLAGFEPKDQLRLKLGDFYILKEEYNKAASNYERVLSVNQSNINVFTRSIWLNLEKLKDNDKALKIAVVAVQTHPEEAMSYNLMGWTLIHMQDYDRAKNFLTKALELDPNLDAANLNLGLVLEKQGDSRLAREYYKKAYLLGNGSSISNIAGKRFNNLQVNISAP